MSNESLFNAAKIHIPGGVNSPVRAFKSVSGTPVFFKNAKGAYIYDTDNKEYIDFVGSWGPMILGHAHPDVIKAVQEKAEQGLSFGAPTEIETIMANKVCKLIPSIEKVRMVSSGTEATMSAIRLARGVTGRDKIIKFEGCYHGHADSLLVKAGSGALTLGIPTSPGVPADLAKYTLTLDYNNCQQLEQIFSEMGNEIACIIVEPVAGNMNCIPASKEFLQTMRKLCDDYESLLLFDEVMSGFRVALGGAQSIYNINPDITALGKVIGGGMPVGAFGGKAKIMDQLAPEGPIYQAGTLSGNPVAMAAGLATLNLLEAPGFFESLETKTNKLVTGILNAARKVNINMTSNMMGGMFGLFFSDKQHINSFADVMNCDIDKFKHFFHGMLQEGIYLAPSAFEAGFVSSAHTDEDLEKTIAAASTVFKQLK